LHDVAGFSSRRRLQLAGQAGLGEAVIDSVMSADTSEAFSSVTPGVSGGVQQQGGFVVMPPARLARPTVAD
jgi:hypothetical protein